MFDPIETAQENQNAAQDAATQVAGAVAIAESIVDAAESIATQNVPVDRTHEIIALISEARDDIRAVRVELEEMRREVQDARTAANLAESAAYVAADAATENNVESETPPVEITDSEGAEVNIVKQDAPAAENAVVRESQSEKKSRRWL